MKPIAILSMALLVVAGCASETEKPVGVGSGTNEMKASPCRGSSKDEQIDNRKAWLNPDGGTLLVPAAVKTPCPELKRYKLRFKAV